MVNEGKKTDLHVDFELHEVQCYLYSPLRRSINTQRKYQLNTTCAKVPIEPNIPVVTKDWE